MPKQPLMKFIRQLHTPVFTTRILSEISGKSLSTTVQSLNYLESQGIIFKVYKGIWAESGNKDLNPYLIIPYLVPKNRAYVSFISALHLYGIIEQIPQTITLASTIHSKIVRTKLGIFSIHQLSPKFFNGFDWYRGEGNFLIAEPEKALVDCLYLSACRKKQFGYFPELNFPPTFRVRRAKEWIKKIPNPKIALYVEKKLNQILLKFKV